MNEFNFKIVKESKVQNVEINFTTLLMLKYTLYKLRLFL